MEKKRSGRSSRPHAKHGLRLARKARYIHLPHRGIRVLLGYMVLLAVAELFYVIVELFHPDLSLSPALLTIDGLMAVSLVTIVFGLFERSAWAWKGALVWFSAAIVYSIALISFFHQQIFSLVRGLVGIALILGIALNGIIIWYLYEKREYFTVPEYHEHAGHADMVFSYLIITFWVLVFVMGTTVGSIVYSVIKQSADQSIIELSSIPFSSSVAKISYCTSKHDGRDDVCLLVLTALEEDSSICTSVKSDLYRFVCERLERRA